LPEKVTKKEDDDWTISFCCLGHVPGFGEGSGGMLEIWRLLVVVDSLFQDGRGKEFESHYLNPTFSYN
jgi:hypothetical protein